MVVPKRDYILNLQGDVVRIVNANPLRYRGYYYDAELEMYYLQSRYYDPTIGRFINADAYASTGQGFLGYNMFAYCGNNPASGIDESGHAWCKISFDAFTPFDSGLVPMIGGGGGGYMGAIQAMNDNETEIKQSVDELSAYVGNTVDHAVKKVDRAVKRILEIQTHQIAMQDMFMQNQASIAKDIIVYLGENPVVYGDIVAYISSFVGSVATVYSLAGIITIPFAGQVFFAAMTVAGTVWAGGRLIDGMWSGMMRKEQSE